MAYSQFDPACCPNCRSTGSTCPYCTSGPAVSIPLTFAGIVNLNCVSCASYNLTVNVPISGCTGNASIAAFCGFGLSFALLSFELIGGHTYIRVILVIAHNTLFQDTQHHFLLNLGVSPLACSGVGAVVLPYDHTDVLGGASQLCDASPATCTAVL